MAQGLRISMGHLRTIRHSPPWNEVTLTTESFLLCFLPRILPKETQIPPQPCPIKLPQHLSEDWGRRGQGVFADSRLLTSSRRRKKPAFIKPTCVFNYTKQLLALVCVSFSSPPLTLNIVVLLSPQYHGLLHSLSEIIAQLPLLLVHSE